MNKQALSFPRRRKSISWQKLFLMALFLCALGSKVFAEGAALTIEEFIGQATANDTVFEEILIDELKLNYSKALGLPAKDLVLSIKGEYDLFISQDDREAPSASVSLSKLFPYTGTEVEVSYKNSPAFTSDKMNSEITALITQSIAQNAFGAATRLKDKLIGVENRVAHYQIIEAYEDYLASLINTYYTWYSAHENLKIGQASYYQNKQLLDDMNKRAESKIALPVDINKVNLLVIGKEENVVSLRENYENVTNLIKKAVRLDAQDDLIPVDPSSFHDFQVSFKKGYEEFQKDSRTYKVLRLLEKQTSLEVDVSADDLLPSTDLLLGYKVSGQEWEVDREDNLFYAGISMDWPFGDQVDEAELQVAKIEHRKTSLSNKNKYLELYVNLKNLHLQIKKEQDLITLVQKKIELSEAILEDETQNYSYGKISLNDYIDAVNKVDTNKFTKILHVVQLKKLLLEWLRLTDRLVDSPLK